MCRSDYLAINFWAFAKSGPDYAHEHLELSPITRRRLGVPSWLCPLILSCLKASTIMYRLCKVKEFSM